MWPTIQLHRAKFDAQLRELRKAAHAMGKDLLTPQMRLLLEHIIKLTPPKNAAQGRAATTRDIHRAVKPFSIHQYRDKRLESIIQKRDYTAFNRYFANIRGYSPMKNATADKWTPELHSRARDNRGRVQSDKRRFVIGRSDLAEFRRYLKKKVANVGLGASGWLAALHLLGGRESGFVERHGTSGGAYRDNRAHPTMPSVAAINRTPWARRRDEGGRIIANALRGRVGPMRTHLKKLVELAGKRSGLSR